MFGSQIFPLMVYDLYATPNIKDEVNTKQGRFALSFASEPQTNLNGNQMTSENEDYARIQNY